LNLRIFTFDMGLMIVSTNYKERLGAVMKLKVGDVVEFKKYEDMTVSETMLISEEIFHKYGKITEVVSDDFFYIEGYGYLFNPKSVARVISDVDGVDINSLNPGDEVLVKATVKTVFDGFIRIKSSVGRADVTKILKRKEPEHFIVKEDYYGMYIGFARELVSDKSKAKLHASLDAANEAATDMQLDDWDVIPYDN